MILRIEDNNCLLNFSTGLKMPRSKVERTSRGEIFQKTKLWERLSRQCQIRGNKYYMSDNKCEIN